MTRARDKHRPLRSGLRIESWAGTRYVPRYVEAGTLRGLATRDSNGRSVLVTNLHVMAGEDHFGNFRNPTGEEVMVQGPNDWRSKVGSNLDWEPLSFVAPNTVDIAVCDLDEEVLADYGLHDFDHSDRKIIAGTKAPEVGMIVTMVGAIAGKATGSVSRVGQLETLSGAELEDIFEIQWNRAIWPGDSGSPVLSEVSPGAGIYKMVGILFTGSGARLHLEPIR